MTDSPAKKAATVAVVGVVAYANVSHFFHPIYNVTDPERRLIPIGLPDELHTHSDHGSGRPIGREVTIAGSTSSSMSSIYGSSAFIWR